MSFDGGHKRRRIIQKLDFENCIVTNMKTAARGRKKLRARITREFEQFSDIPEQTHPCESLNSSLEVSQTSRPSSPVLIRKQNRSTVFGKREKKNSQEELKKFSEHSNTEEAPSPPVSPVFKTFKKYKTGNVPLKRNHENQNASGSANKSDVVDSEEDSYFMSSFQIDDFSQESEQSVKISSVESPNVQTDASGSYSDYPNVRRLASTSFNTYEKCGSPIPIRKNYKKNSLLGRLHNLQQKQASEKRLWQYENRKNSSNSLTFSIVSFWKEEFNYFLKCQSCLPDSKTTFLIIDSRWVPNIKNIKDGSMLQLYPPWQTLSPEGTTMTVLLSVIFLDILDGTKEPVVKKEKSLHTLSTDQFENDEGLFIDSLFSSCCSGFLC